MQAPMTLCHLIIMWHEWNMNANDVMMMWFALFAKLATSCLPCLSHAHMHGTCALNKYGASKYLSGLTCMQADYLLEEVTIAHCQVLNT